MKTKSDTKIQKYAAKVLRARIKELGLNNYRLVKENNRLINLTTTTNIMSGKHAVSIQVLGRYLDILGLEMIIRPKQDNNEDTSTDE
jgi:hypothetical protein